MGSQNIGKCKSCERDIYRGENTGAYMGHKSDCRNIRTQNLDK